jgi:hypothetical protein
MHQNKSEILTIMENIDKNFFETKKDFKEIFKQFKKFTINSSNYIKDCALNIKNHEKYLKECVSDIQKHEKYLSDLKETNRNVEETLINVLLAIRQTEILQAWYPAQKGFPEMKVIGSHPIKVKSNIKGNK